MAAAISLPGLLTTLTESLSSAISPFCAPPNSLSPPADGISLLDTKNDLLLSYLQNIVFLIIYRLRDESNGGKPDSDARTIGREAVQKLVEIRAYLEKGVRPIEGRLKYQIEKVLRAAHDAECSSIQPGKESTHQNGKLTNGKTATAEGADASDSASDSAGSADIATSQEAQPKRDDLSYRPNPTSLLRRPSSSEPARSSSSSNARSNGTYKPPRITPTSMPDLPSAATTGSSSRAERRNRKSHLLDEYISTELSSAPNLEPSIGSNSTILRRGRGALSTRERDKERERTEYEERNFSRLPKESKAERRKSRARGEDGRGRDRFGGEDWTGLGVVGDRVARSVGKGLGSGSGKEGQGVVGVLERREKRRREGGDVRAGGGGRGGIGESFEKKRKIMEGRAARQRRAG